MIKLSSKIAVTLLVLFNLQTAWAQVRFNLSLMPDQRTYLVSMVPETTWSVPQNTVASIQVVLQLPADKPFMAGEIKSLVPGISWSDNAYVERPASASAYNFVCFVLNERGTKKFGFEAGLETPLFTFVNLEPGCVGAVELVENNSTIVQQVVQQDRLNITQNMTVLGARGNAFSGLLNKSVDCTLLNTSGPNLLVENLRVFPVPASTLLTISWENKSGNGADALMINNMLGKIVAIEKINSAAGEQKIQVDVAVFPTGLYHATLSGASGEKQAFRFLVSRF